MGYLERVGLQKALSGNSGATTAVLKLLQKYKIKPGNKTFTEYVDSEIKSGGKRLLMKLTASTIVEGETGMLQEISDIAFKEIYDIMKGEEMFRTPETIGEGLVQIAKGAVAEAIGGFVMGTPGAINSALTGGNFTELSDEEYATFEKVMEDESLTAAYKEKLKQDVLSGKKSKEEALQELNNSEEVKGNMDEIPDYYTPAQKKKALELLTKRSKLQDIVDKGNKQLVTKEQTEIDAINDALTAMSTDTDTSTTTETDAEGNTITNTVTVDEASAKIKLEEDGIKNPTQEQIDAKQAEMLEEEVSQEDLSAIDKLAKATKVEEKEDMDVTVDKARDGDIKAQEKLDKYGLKWAKETIYRFVGKSEVDALEKGETIEGKSKTAGVDVTSSSEVTSASDAEYRITFKEEGFDDKKKGSRVRMKSEKDGWVKDGYNKSDVLKIEKKNDDGTYETVYDS